MDMYITALHLSDSAFDKSPNCKASRVDAAQALVTVQHAQHEHNSRLYSS